SPRWRAVWGPSATPGGPGGRVLLPAEPSPPPAADSRVPRRNPEVRGPIDVYYYDHLAEVLGPDAPTETALARREGGDVLAWETLNLLDRRLTGPATRHVVTATSS